MSRGGDAKVRHFRTRGIGIAIALGPDVNRLGLEADMNRRTSRTGVAMAIFVGVLLTASAVAAQDPTRPGTVIPHSPVLEAPGECNLGAALGVPPTR